jgi:hypothetical protein
MHAYGVRNVGLDDIIDMLSLWVNQMVVYILQLRITLRPPLGL